MSAGDTVTTATFTAHNILLDDGTLTKPDARYRLDEGPRFTAARDLLDTAFPGGKTGLRIADLGCLEGGFAVEFARMGFDVVGIEVRKSNIEACEYVKQRVNLPNLTFVHDDAWNMAKYGPFDAIFCSGLFYHLDRPREFLGLLSSQTRRQLILDTHFSTDRFGQVRYLPGWLRGTKFRLSPLTTNEGLRGRWYPEPAPRDEHQRWASWDNRWSFWLQREQLMFAMQEAGFDLVMEKADFHKPRGPDDKRWDYKWFLRAMFVGLKMPRRDA